MLVVLVALHFFLSDTEQVRQVGHLRDVPVLDGAVLVQRGFVVFEPELDGRSYGRVGLVDAIKMGCW